MYSSGCSIRSRSVVKHPRKVAVSSEEVENFSFKTATDWFLTFFVVVIRGPPHH